MKEEGRRPGYFYHKKWWGNFPTSRSTCPTSVSTFSVAVRYGRSRRHIHVIYEAFATVSLCARASHSYLCRGVLRFCATCYTSLTVNHILIECPQFNHLRQQYHFGSTLKELFKNTSVNDIIAFIKDIHFILAYNRCCTSFVLAISLGFNNLFL